MKQPTIADLASSVIAWGDAAEYAEKYPHSLFGKDFCDESEDMARKLLKIKLDKLQPADQPTIFNLMQLEKLLRQKQNQPSK